MDKDKKNKKKKVNSAIENVRNKKLIGSSLEAEVYVYLGDKYLKGLVENIEMKKVLIVSEFVLLNDKNEKIDDSLYEEKDTQEDLLVLLRKLLI